MKRLIGRRVLTAAMGLFVLSAGSSAASAQTAAGPLGTAAQTVRSAASSVRTAATSAVATVTGSVIQAAPASSVTLSLQRPIAREAAWLQQAGWPLYALVDRYSAGAPLGEEALHQGVHHLLGWTRGLLRPRHRRMPEPVGTVGGRGEAKRW